MKRQNQDWNFAAKFFNGRTGLALISAAAVAWSSQQIKAATLNWDPSLTDSASGGGTGTWDLNNTADWFNGTSDVQWTDSSAAGVDVAVFGGPIGTVTLNSPLSAGELIFSSTGSTSSTGYSLSGANTLSLGSILVGTLNLGIDASALTTGTTTISAPISIVSAVTDTWTVGGGSTLIDSGGISGAVALSKAGNGILTLAVDNSSLTGGVQLSGGQLNINSANALGSGAFSISTSFLDNTSSGPLTDNASAIRLNGTLTFIGTNSLNLGSNTVTIGASRVINDKASNLEFDGSFVESGTGGYSLTKEGAGTLTLSNNANAWTGVVATGTTPEVGTVILGGKLDLSTTGQLPNVPLLIGGGELSISNTGSGARTQTISASAGLSPVGSLAFTSGQNIITLNNSGTGSTVFTAATVSRTIFNAATGSQGATELFRGTGLGTAAPGTSGTANVIFTTPPAVTAGSTNTDFYSATGTGSGTQTPVFRGALIDTSATGNGIGFATYNATNGVQLLPSADQLSVTTPAGYTASSTGDNILVHNTSLTLVAANPGKTTNTLQIDNTSGSLITFTDSGTALDPRNGVLFSGTSPITLTGGSLTGSGADVYLLSTDTGLVSIASNLLDNNAANTFQKNIVFGGSPTSGGFVVTGTMTSSSSGAFYVNGVTVTDNGTANVTSNGFTVDGGGELILGPNFVMTASAVRPFLISSGSTIDTNGLAALNLDYIGDGAFNSGGTLTNSKAAPTTITLSQGSSTGNARTYTGIISGNINLVRAAISTVTQTQTLSGASTYTGTTLISSGSLRIGINNALPVTTPLSVTAGGALPSLLDLNGFNQTVGSLSSASLTTGGTIANNTASTASIFTVNGSASTSFGGLIVDNTGTGGTVGLAVRGTGILSLTGNNTYSGGTTIYGGTLKANNSTGSTGSGFVTVNSGGILAGTGFIGNGTTAGPVTINSGGHLSPGDNSLGTLTIGTGGSLSLAGGSILDYDFNDVNLSDETVVNGGLTLNATHANPIGVNVFTSGQTTKFDPQGATGTETFNLLQYSGTALPSGTLTNFSVLNPVSATAPWSYTFDSAPGAGLGGTNLVQLVITFPPPESWAGGTSSNWGTATSVGNNWSAAQVPNSAGQSVTFPGTASRFTVDLDGSRTVGSISFTGGGSNSSYTIDQGSSPAGGTLTLDNNGLNGTISNSSGVLQTISAPITLAAGVSTNIKTSTTSDMLVLSGGITAGATSPIVASGLGTLTLGSSSAFHGGITIGGGDVQISTSTGLGASDSVATLNGGTLEATAAGIIETRTFKIGSSGGTLQLDQPYEIDGTIVDATPSALTDTLNVNSGTLIFRGTSSNAGGLNIQNSSILQLGNSAGTVGATVGGGALTLASGAVANVGSTSPGLASDTTVSINSEIAGSGALNQNGSGTLTLSGGNAAYSGNVIINGTLNLNNATSVTATGTGPITFNNNSTLTETTSAQIGNGAVGGSSTTQTPATGGQITTFQGTVNINTGAGTLTIAEQLSGSAATVNRNGGTGTLVLGVANNTVIGDATGFANTLSGTFNNSSGSLLLVSRGAGSSNVAYNFSATNGVVTIGPLSGSISLGSITGNEPIAGSTGAARLAVGGLNATTTYSGVIGSANGNELGLAQSGTGTLTVSGQNTYSGQALTNATGAPTAVTSGTLIAGSSTAGDGSSGPFGNTNGTAPSYVLVGNQGQGTSTSPVLLTTAALLANSGVTVGNPIVISGGGSSATTTAYTLSMGGATTGTSTFSGGVILENNLTVTQPTGGQVNLTGGITGTNGETGPDSTSVIDSGPPTTGSGASANNYGFQVVTFSGPGNTVVSGTANTTPGFAGLGIYDANTPDPTNAISLGFFTSNNGYISVAVTGGTTTFASANQYSGSTTVSGGELIYGNLATSLAARPVTALSVSSGGEVQLASAATHAGRNVLVVSNGFSVPSSAPPNSVPPTPVAAPALTLSGTGTIDLTNNDMIVHSGSGGIAQLAALNAAADTGFNGPTGAWTGTGLITSAGTKANNPKSNTGLGIVVNDTHQSGTLSGTSLMATFDGQSVADGDVLVKYTYFGDALLTGSVTAADYIQIDNGFTSQSGANPLQGWYNGDFNYDGKINGDDYTLIDNAFNTQGGVSLAGVSAGPAEMIATNTSQISGVASPASVPEPTTLTMLGIGAAGLLTRRRRRNA
jgi:fibronectin-binding autotransporter adhesin